MDVKLLFRWLIPFLLLLLISLGCDMNEVTETYFPPLSTHTPPPTSTAPVNSSQNADVSQSSTLVNAQYESIECIEDENTYYYEVSAYDHSTAHAYLNTYLYIHRGANIQISAAGIACIDPDPNLCYTPAQVSRLGSKLVGKIGNGEMFSIGDHFENNFDFDSGILYLGFRDSDYENNRGFYEVCVTVH